MMNVHGRCLLLLLLLTASVPAVAQRGEGKKVKRCFEVYKQAILNDQGSVAAEQVDSTTLAYYAKVLDQARTADSATVQGLGLLDKLMVLSVRHRTPKADLLRFDGRSMFIHAVESGMVGKSSVMHNELGTVEVNGRFALGQLIARGQRTPFNFQFRKEHDSWKLDLTSLFPVSTMAFEQLVKESGGAEDTFLLELLTAVSGRKPGPEVWWPVRE